MALRIRHNIRFGLAGKLYMIRYEHEDYGDGSVEIYHVISPKEPTVQSIVENFDLNFEPEKGESITIECIDYAPMI